MSNSYFGQRSFTGHGTFTPANLHLVSRGKPCSGWLRASDAEDGQLTLATLDHIAGLMATVAFEARGGREFLIDLEAGIAPLSILKNLSSRRRFREFLIKTELNLDDPRRSWPEIASHLRYVGEQATADLEQDLQAPATLPEMMHEALPTMVPKCGFCDAFLARLQQAEQEVPA